MHISGSSDRSREKVREQKNHLCDETRALQQTLQNRQPFATDTRSLKPIHNPEVCVHNSLIHLWVPWSSFAIRELHKIFSFNRSRSSVSK